MDFNQKAEDVIRGIDLTGKRAIVTGGVSGIGIETVRASLRRPGGFSKVLVISVNSKSNLSLSIAYKVK